MADEGKVWLVASTPPRGELSGCFTFLSTLGPDGFIKRRIFSVWHGGNTMSQGDSEPPPTLESLQAEVNSLQRQIWFLFGLTVVALFAGTMNVGWSIMTLAVAIGAEHWCDMRTS